MNGRLCEKSFTVYLFFCLAAAGPAARSEPLPEVPDEGKTISKSYNENGEEETWAVSSSYRSQYLYPSNYGEVGIFRVRSAESLPEGTLTLGVGAEFYSVNDGPAFNALSVGSAAQTLAESLFVGYSPVKQLTLGVMRRSSSTTFGNPPQLITDLGDLNLTGLYSFPLTPSMALAPLADFLIASNFNSLTPNGNTLSLGVGLAYSFSFYPGFGLPLFLHANLIYHMPQIRGTAPVSIAPETFFGFSRYDTVTLALGAEIKLGDFIPFLELIDSENWNSGIGFPHSPSKISVGARITPINNKSLALLVGGDVALGRSYTVGVPFSPGYQIIAQLSYTVGLLQTERKHYYRTQDVNVVDRKFVIKKAIAFKVGSAILESESTSTLDQIAKVIEENKVRKLLIVGHTDSSNGEEFNLKLSLDRANTVKKYLVSRGIPDETLMTQGYGKRRPRASNNSEEGRALNRRVEFLIVE